MLRSSALPKLRSQAVRCLWASRATKHPLLLSSSFSESRKNTLTFPLQYAFPVKHYSTTIEEVHPTDEPNNLQDGRFLTWQEKLKEDGLSSIKWPKEILEELEKNRTCKDCGIKVQFTDPQAEGFTVIPKITERRMTANDVAFARALDSVDAEGKNNLLEMIQGKYDEVSRTNPIPERSPPAEETTKQATSRKTWNDETLKRINAKFDAKGGCICARCHLAKTKDVFTISPAKKSSEVLEKIPRSATVIYAVDGATFPLGINPSVFLERPDLKIIFVITKTDLVERAPGTSLNWFYKLCYESIVKLIPSFSKPTVILISSKRHSETDKLISLLKRRTYVIGEENSGKSMLIEIVKKRLTFTPKNETRLSSKTKPDPSSVALWPGFTREMRRIKLPTGKVLIDTPGFCDGISPFRLIDRGRVPVATQPKPVRKAAIKNSSYESLQNGKCLVIGGLVYIVAPQDSVSQIRTTINCKVHRTRNLERARELARCAYESNEINPSKHMSQYWFDSKPEAESQLERHILPPFAGSIDIVVHGVGFITITPTGRKKNDQHFEIWYPKGLKVIARKPFVHFMFSAYKAVTDNGELMETHLANYAEPLYAPVYRISEESSNPLPEEEENKLWWTKYALTRVCKDEIEIGNIYDGEVNELSFSVTRMNESPVLASYGQRRPREQKEKEV